MSARAGLFIESAGVIVEPGAPMRLIAGAAATLRRFGQRGVPAIALSAPASSEDIDRLLATEQVTLAGHVPLPAAAGAIAAAARRCEIDLFKSWLISADPGLLRVAAMAGCQGAVLIGDRSLPEDDFGIVLARARDLADAPRVMLPKDGGCWHN